MSGLSTFVSMIGARMLFDLLAYGCVIKCQGARCDEEYSLNEFGEICIDSSPCVGFDVKQLKILADHIGYDQLSRMMNEYHTETKGGCVVPNKTINLDSNRQENYMKIELPELSVYKCSDLPPDEEVVSKEEAEVFIKFWKYLYEIKRFESFALTIALGFTVFSMLLFLCGVK